VPLALGEGERTCETAMVALAGRVLVLFGAGERTPAEEALALLDRLAPATRALRSYGHPVAELLRPVLGAEEAARRLERVEPSAHAGSAI